MRIVVAVGGNALLKRGEPMTAANQRKNVRQAARAIVQLYPDHELVISHGNGPQVGLLALQAANYKAVEAFPLDVLGAQTEGMIGYMIEQELGNQLPFEQPLASILTMVEVDAGDPAFDNPTKPIGPVYTLEEARQYADQRGWTMKPDGDGWRRVVPSPIPRRIFQLRPIKWLLEKGTIVICTGGGGIPTMYEDGRRTKLRGAEVVIDKDLASALLAKELKADRFIMATDADGVYTDWGQPEAKRLTTVTYRDIKDLHFEAGSMGPKVTAACWFAQMTGKPSAIGGLQDLKRIIAGEAGTTIHPTVDVFDDIFGLPLTAG